LGHFVGLYSALYLSFLRDQACRQSALRGGAGGRGFNLSSYSPARIASIVLLYPTCGRTLGTARTFLRFRCSTNLAALTLRNFRQGLGLGELRRTANCSLVKPWFSLARRILTWRKDSNALSQKTNSQS